MVSRKHTILKTFSLSGDFDDELMLYGSVRMGLKNGASLDVPWAGRIQLVRTESSETRKIKFYQVYLVGRSNQYHRKSIL